MWNAARGCALSRLRFAALLVLILSASSFAAQIPAARFQISGRTAKTGSLFLASSDASITSLQASSGSRQVQVRLRPSLSRNITVPLIARSNSPYRLLVKSSAQPLRILVRSTDPNSGTLHLAPEATNVRSIGEQLAGGLNEMTLLEGPRISSGGNDATLDNAIRLTVEVELPEQVSEADLTFTMEFPAN